MFDPQTVMVSPQGGLNFYDLSHGWRSDCAAGPLYPCYVEEVIPGDYASISFTAEVKTEPAKVPTMGTFDCYIETFFCRMANYYSQLHTNLPNAPMLAPGVGSFHVLKPNDVATSGPGYYNPAPGSLLDYMGFPCQCSWWNQTNASTSYRKAIPLVPFVCYYDIFRSWYADPQFPNFYVGGWDSGDFGNWKYRAFGLDALSNAIQGIYNSTTPLTVRWDDDSSTANPFSSLIMGPYDSSVPVAMDVSWDSPHHFGLVLGPYRADIMNNFLSSDTVAGMVSHSSIVVNDGKITFDQIVATEKNYDFDNRSVLSGGRYRDWVRSQYNVTPSTDLCQPQFLGRIHWTVGFQDVVANTVADNQVLGDLGGRGFGQTSRSYPIRMAFTDNGYIFSIFRIVPRLDYNGYVEPYLQRTTTEDIFTPAYDNSPFEPVKPYDIDARFFGANTESAVPVVGYRPAWSGYRYRVNRSHGSFNMQTQNFWVLQRTYGPIDPGVTGILETFSPYIRPSDGDVPFARVGDSARNFRVQIAISSKWRRPIRANSLPSLK